MARRAVDMTLAPLLGPADARPTTVEKPAGVKSAARQTYSWIPLNGHFAASCLLYPRKRTFRAMMSALFVFLHFWNDAPNTTSWIIHVTATTRYQMHVDMKHGLTRHLSNIYPNVESHDLLIGCQ